MIAYYYLLRWAILSCNEWMKEGLKIVITFRYFLSFEVNLLQDLIHELATVRGENVDVLGPWSLWLIIWPFEDRIFLGVCFEGRLPLSWQYLQNWLNFRLSISLSLFLASLNNYIGLNFLNRQLSNHFICHCVYLFKGSKCRLSDLLSLHFLTQLQLRLHYLLFLILKNLWILVESIMIYWSSS